MYQLRYWNQLKEFRTHVIYLHLYAVKSQHIENTINITLAIASSSSIAAWAIWKDFQFIWAAIIAISQVISAIKPFLPYKQRKKAVYELSSALQAISLECEKGWHDVSEGILTESEIHNKCFELRDKAMKAEKKCLNSLILPPNDSLLHQSEVEADIYLKNNYNGG